MLPYANFINMLLFFLELALISSSVIIQCLYLALFRELEHRGKTCCKVYQNEYFLTFFWIESIFWKLLYKTKNNPNFSKNFNLKMNF